VGESTDITSYTGSNASSTLWDFVYNISGWATTGGHTDVWGIIAPPGTTANQPATLYVTSGWTGLWDSNVTTGEYAGTFNGTGMIGQAAFVWSWNGITDNASGFHFQSSGEPALHYYYGGTSMGTDMGGGYEYSVPEPGTLLLTALGCLGLAAWRRRTTA